MKMQMHDAKMNTICILGVVNEAKKKIIDGMGCGDVGCGGVGCGRRMWAAVDMGTHGPHLFRRTPQMISGFSNGSHIVYLTL